MYKSRASKREERTHSRNTQKRIVKREEKKIKQKHNAQRVKGI